MKGSHVLWWERQYIYRKVNYVRYTENGVAAVILWRSHGDRGFVIRGRLNLCTNFTISAQVCAPIFKWIEISSRTYRDVLAIYDERNFEAEYIMRLNCFQFFFSLISSYSKVTRFFGGKMCEQNLWLSAVCI